MKLNRWWKLSYAHHIHCARLFYCFAQLPYVVIYLLTIIQVKITWWQFVSMSKLWSPTIIWQKKRVSLIKSFSFSTVAIKMHGRHKQGFINWEWPLCKSLSPNAMQGKHRHFMGLVMLDCIFEAGVCMVSNCSYITV